MKAVAQKEKKCPCTQANCGVRGDCVACCKYLLCINKTMSNPPFCLIPENKHLVSYDLLERVCNRLQDALLASEA